MMAIQVNVLVVMAGFVGGGVQQVTAQPSPLTLPLQHVVLVLDDTCDDDKRTVTLQHGTSSSATFVVVQLNGPLVRF
jgi:hypothetical protein